MKFSYRTTFRDDGSDRDDAPETAGDITTVLTRSGVLSTLVKGLSWDEVWRSVFLRRQCQHADDSGRRGHIGGRLSSVLLVYRCIDCSRRHIHNNCYFLTALSPYRSVLVVRCNVIYNCTEQTVWRNDDVFPVCFQLSGPRGRHGENLALRMHTSATSCCRRWGLASLRDGLGGPSKMRNFVRGYRRSDTEVVCLTRKFIGDVTRQQQVAVQVHLCLLLPLNDLGQLADITIIGFKSCPSLELVSLLLVTHLPPVSDILLPLA